MRLPCPVGDTQSAKSSSFGLLRCIPVDIISPGDLKILETSRLNFLCQFCFQQSAGNSTRPKVKVVFGAVGKRFLHQDIRDL
jgi:hypothetical protein